MPKTIIVSNRLPVRIEKSPSGKLIYQPSEGGLATGLGSVYKQRDNIWVGWPGVFIDNARDKESIEKNLSKESMHPVFLTQEEIKGYYEGFSNETLWPVFHYFHQYAYYKRSLWNAYQRANEKFAETIVRLLKPGDTLWIHDYQLLLLPKLIRAKIPKIAIGFFLHIPFPSHEVFRLIPWRKELLDGMLGADLIGFHTYDDMRHFLSAVSRICYLSNQHGELIVDNRTVEVDAFPMGIDYDKYAAKAASKETINSETQFRTSLGNQKLMLSIDRLDYSKGIPARLTIFDLFLTKYPQYRGKVSLIMIVVPSRDQVGQYKELKEEVDWLVGGLNGKYGTMNWTPIHYFYRSFPFEELSAFYRMADVALVTPMRDGMNLVCKEFVASKLDKKGVLILSEMCGASKELSDAIIINPNDKHKVADSINRALSMPIKEQVAHMENMQKTIKRYNVHHWVALFLGRLNDIKQKQKSMGTRQVDEVIVKKLRKRFVEAPKRLIFLDYDGTLVGFKNLPEDAKPDKELVGLLTKLTKDKKNHVVIISGRDRETLDKWLGHLSLDLICEHGVWLRSKGQDWETIDVLSNRWKGDIRPILEMYVNKTPGSFIEEKDFSIAWHYRRVETGFGELRAREITSHLKYLSVNMKLQVLEGHKVVEIKNLEVNKGKAAAKWLKKNKADFIMAIGDDWTDEDTFKVMPKKAVTIKVGSGASEAKYGIKDPQAVRGFLSKLASSKN